MRTIAYHSCKDKVSWGEGAWLNEPDKLQWRDRETHLPCLIVRNVTVTGALCGYVGVRQRHALYGHGYGHPLINKLSVHGGITYASFCQRGPEDKSICHIAGKGEVKKVWWLGFDCSHAGDLSPRLEHLLGAIKGPCARASFKNDTIVFTEYQDIYRDLAYVKAECEALAAQLASL